MCTNFYADSRKHNTHLHERDPIICQRMNEQNFVQLHIPLENRVFHYDGCSEFGNHTSTAKANQYCRISQCERIMLKAFENHILVYTRGGHLQDCERAQKFRVLGCYTSVLASEQPTYSYAQTSQKIEYSRSLVSCSMFADFLDVLYSIA